MQTISCFTQSDPIQSTRSKPLNVRISPFSLFTSLEFEENMDFSLQRKQAKISTVEKVDFFFTPTRKLSTETPLKKTSYKRRLLFEGEEEIALASLTPLKTKRTYSESTLIEKQITDNKKYLKIQKKLVDQCLQKSHQNLKIETINNSENPDMPTIETKTLDHLLDTRTNVVLIDTRFSFEYEAGHIQNSININNPFHLETLFFEYGHLLFSGNFLQKLPELATIPKKNLESWLKTQNADETNHQNMLEEPPIIIIHCEFSQKRGPKLLRYLRKRDREINEEHYPNLIYPHIFLLSGDRKSVV